MAKKWINFLDPLGNRQPAERTVYRKSRKEVRTTYVNKYAKMYPDKKFTIRKSKKMKPSGDYLPFEVFYRRKK